VVALGRGPQQLGQQQGVAHHPLHRLDEEGAQVDVVGLPPGSGGEREEGREEGGELVRQRKDVHTKRFKEIRGGGAAVGLAG